MVQRGKDLAFALEPARAAEARSTAHKLQGRPLCEFTIGALHEVHGTHSAAPDLFDDAPSADDLPWWNVGGGALDSLQRFLP